jgi:hypothetical protein
VRAGSISPAAEVTRGGHAIAPVDVAPAAVEEPAVGAPEAAAAAVVDVEHADPALGEELDRERQCRAAVGGRTAVADHAQRRQLAGRCLPLGAGGRIVEGVRDIAVAGVKLDRARHADRVRVELGVQRAAGDLLALRRRIEHDERDGRPRRLGREGEPPAAGGEDRRLVLAPFELYGLQVAAARIEQLERVRRRARDDAGDAPVVEEGVAAHREDPARVADLAVVEPRQRPRCAVGAEPVEVPPPAAIGAEVQHAVGAPLRLEDRFLRAAGDAARVGHRAVRAERPDPQLGAVPRHPRVIPGEPGEPPPVRVGPRAGHEVAPGHDDARLSAAVGRQRDELVDHAAVLVALAHAHHRRAVADHAPVRVTQRVRARRRGRQRLRIGAGAVLAVQARVAEVREEHRVAVKPARAAAVLVHARAHVAPRRRDVDRLAVRPQLGDDAAAALVGAVLQPAQPPGLGEDGREPPARTAGDEVRAQLRRPCSEGANAGHYIASRSRSSSQSCE